MSEQFEKNAMPKMMESAGVKTAVEFDARLRGQDYSLRQLKRKWAIQQFTRHSIGQAIGSIPETTHQEMLDRYEEELESYENQPAPNGSRSWCDSTEPPRGPKPNVRS